MADGGAISRPGTGSYQLGIASMIAAATSMIGTFFHPINIFRFSFFIAAALCFYYSMALPTRFFVTTGRLLLSDTSIYYFLSAVGMLLTERALKEFDRKRGGGQ